MEESSARSDKPSFSQQSVLQDFETLLQSTKGRIGEFHNEDSHSNWVFCKPKLLPLKTFTIEKLEKLQKEAEEKLMNSNLSV